jgi:hypothetical protein
MNNNYNENIFDNVHEYVVYFFVLIFVSESAASAAWYMCLIVKLMLIA